MFHLDRKWGNRLFQGLFWVSITAGLLLMALVLLLGLWMLIERPEHYDGGECLLPGR